MNRKSGIVDYKKILNKPIFFSFIFMIITLLVYFFGPINYYIGFDKYELIGIILILSYIFALVIGYEIGLYSIKYDDLKNIDFISKKNKYNILKIINIIILINFILTISNAFVYVGVNNIIGLWDNMINGLLNPATSYYEKDVTSRSGSIIVYVTLILSPLMYLAKISTLMYWKDISKTFRVIMIISIIIEIFRWISIGTNKGLFDILILFFSVFLVKHLNNKLNGTNKKLNRKIFLSITILATLCLFFFNYTVSSRVNGQYNNDYFLYMPYSLIPENSRFFIEKVDSYLTQGFANMIACIKYCEWKPTFFFGNSRFLMDILYRLTGIDLTSRTYPYQLDEFGVDPLASWHSAYAWWASDLSFIGIIFFMFIVGIFFSKIAKESIIEMNAVSCTLFYMVLVGIIYSSCNNSVFAYSNMFCGFMGLFIYRFLKRYTRFKYVKISIMRKYKIKLRKNIYEK